MYLNFKINSLSLWIERSLFPWKIRTERYLSSSRIVANNFSRTCKGIFQSPSIHWTANNSLKKKKKKKKIPRPYKQKHFPNCERFTRRISPIHVVAKRKKKKKKSQEKSESRLSEKRNKNHVRNKRPINLDKSVDGRVGPGTRRTRSKNTRQRICTKVSN